MVVLTPDPLSLDAAYAAVRGPERGAVVVFVGTVRGTEDGRPIASIEYEAYASMAEKEMRRIVSAARAKRAAAVAVYHRIGPVPVGEAAVIVAAASAHRPEAFAACREVIDEVKHVVPIWKTDFAACASPS